jgi:hypothetical protein
MLRMILGVVTGFFVWMILWVGGSEVISMISPGWYGAHEIAFEKAIFNRTPFEADSAILCIYLVRIVVISLLSGFIAAFIAKETGRTTLALGILLVLGGFGFQLGAWSLLPNWYHAASLILIIPMTLAGGRLQRSAQR